MATLISDNLNTTINTSLSRFLYFDPLNMVKNYLFHDNTTLEYARKLAEKRQCVLDEINQAVSRKNGFNGQSSEDNDTEEHWVFASPKTPKQQFQAINCYLCGNYQQVGNSILMFELPEICLCHCYD